MKEKVYEEFGIKPDYLIYKKNYIWFEYNDFKYIVMQTNYDEKKLGYLNQLVNYLDNYGFFFHQLIGGKNGFIMTFGDKNYVLLKLRIIKERVITVDEILKLSSISVKEIGITNIEEKIDFLEQYLANYENLELINFNYFIGLAENAIEMFNLYGAENKNYINHRRLVYNENTLEFYNPLNLVIDYHTRDLAEYVKSLFISGENKVIEYLKYLNYKDWYTYFARMLFPSFYFDFIDNYIKNGQEFNKKRISNLANSYEKMLRDTYYSINSKVIMPNITWLSNVNNI